MMTDNGRLLEKLRDSKFFCETSLFCVDKNSKKVPFIWNKAQNDYDKNKTNDDSILKARKMGFSLKIMADWLHACVFFENMRAVIMSHEEGATRRLLERVRYFIATSLIPIKTKKNSESEISFPDTNSTLWIGTAGQKAFGRGDDITHLHLSEYLWYPDLSVITGAREALRNNARVVKESTANGVGNPGYQSWLAAVEGRSNSRAHFYGWFWDEDYKSPDNSPITDLTRDEELTMKTLGLTWAQMRWRRKKIGDMEDPEKFPQEYPACWQEAFLSTGQNVFAWQDIKRQEDSRRPVKIKGEILNRDEEIEFDRNARGCLEVFLTVNSPHQRVLITSDAGEGIEGGDASSASAWDIETWEQLAHWHGWIDPMAFAYVLQNLGKYYNWAWIANETNYPGNATQKKLEELGYPKGKLWKDRLTGKYWKTEGPNRGLAVSAFREAIRQDTMKINSQRTINEMRTFIRSKTNKLEAESGCHDDCILEASIAAFLLKYHEFERPRASQPPPAAWLPHSMRRKVK
jgi:hypothetical protein